MAFTVLYGSDNFAVDCQHTVRRCTAVHCRISSFVKLCARVVWGSKAKWSSPISGGLCLLPRELYTSHAANVVSFSSLVRVGLDLLGYGRQENVRDVSFPVGAEMRRPLPSVVSNPTSSSSWPVCIFWIVFYLNLRMYLCAFSLIECLWLVTVNRPL